MECQFCTNVFATKSILNTHQKKAKYCLKIQGKTPQSIFKCNICETIFTSKYNLTRHLKLCESNSNSIKYQVENNKLKEENLLLKQENQLLSTQLEKLQASYEKLSLTAVKRPTVSNKTMNVNNFIKNMPPLTVEDIESSVPMLTLEHHAKGAEEYFPEEILRRY